MTIEQQANEVDKVKRSESGMIVDPVTMSPDAKVSDALEVMKKYKISGVPITQKDGKLVGTPQVALKLPLIFSLLYGGAISYDFSRDLSSVVYARAGGHADLYLLSHK